MTGDTETRDRSAGRQYESATQRTLIVKMHTQKAHLCLPAYPVPCYLTLWSLTQQHLVYLRYNCLLQSYNTNVFTSALEVLLHIMRYINFLLSYSTRHFCTFDAGLPVMSQLISSPFSMPVPILYSDCAVTPVILDT